MFLIVILAFAVLKIWQDSKTRRREIPVNGTEKEILTEEIIKTELKSICWRKIFGGILVAVAIVVDTLLPFSKIDFSAIYGRDGLTTGLAVLLVVAFLISLIPSIGNFTSYQ